MFRENICVKFPLLGSFVAINLKKPQSRKWSTCQSFKIFTLDANFVFSIMLKGSATGLKMVPWPRLSLILNKEIMIKVKKTISKMVESPENGVRLIVFLTEVDFRMDFNKYLHSTLECDSFSREEIDRNSEMGSTYYPLFWNKSTGLAF